MTNLVQLDYNDLQTAIKNCLRESIEEIKSIPAPASLPDRISLIEACELTGFSKSQMYKLSHLGEIPKSHYGKKLIFSRKSILEWRENRTISATPAGEVMENRLAKTAKRHLK
jgi:predicted DNA-binding transcriptional regulator AlpA